MKTKQLKLVLCVLVASLMTLPIMANVSRGSGCWHNSGTGRDYSERNVSDASGPLIGVCL